MLTALLGAFLWAGVGAAVGPAVEAPIERPVLLVQPAEKAPPKARTGEAWVGDEDLLAVFQSFCALGAAAAVGAVALLPAHGLFFVIVLIGVATQTPALLFAGPAVIIASLVLLQAMAAGVTVTVIGATSDHFRGRSFLPSSWAKSLKARWGLDPAKGAARFFLGAPWLTGFAGYLAGAGLGLTTGAVLSVPLVVAGLLLFNAPPGNRSGVVALVGSLIAAAVLVATSVTFIAPPFAALAHHLTKEAIPEDN